MDNSIWAVSDIYECMVHCLKPSFKLARFSALVRPGLDTAASHQRIKSG